MAVASETVMCGNCSAQMPASALADHDCERFEMAQPPELLDPKANYYRLGEPLQEYQVIHVIEARLSRVQFIGYLEGNIIKYALRAGRKGDGVRDFEKLLVYTRMRLKQ